ncbi:hypothetical protein MMC13_006364 [Lambiella insularis]|nr:hypothetical protein [Lambiella insularis]
MPPSVAASTSPSPLSPSTYRYTPNETSVFSSSPLLLPYKTALLPLWRFRTPAIARKSSSAIYARFLSYDAEDDFVGMDMCRKYLQMGMTRAKRYANYRGGRKYAGGKGEGEGEEDGMVVAKTEEGSGKRKGKCRVQVVKSDGHAGKEDKEEASQIFREVWEMAKAHPGYAEKKRVYLAEQRRRDRERKRNEKEPNKIRHVRNSSVKAEPD